MADDVRVSTEVRYTPIIRPDPPSLSRQLAYQENTPLLGPDDDPEGWHNFPPIEVHGRIFRSRYVTTIMTVSSALMPASTGLIRDPRYPTLDSSL